MNDKELFEQLRDGPFPRQGFDEQLRKRINNRLDAPEISQTSVRKRGSGWMIAASLLLVVAFAGTWVWMDNAVTKEEVALQQTAGPSAVAPEISDEEAMPPVTAMLIGLRKDTLDPETGLESNTYRTVLIVPDDDGFAKGAESSGIWMPYGQNFWRIDNAPSNVADQFLTAAVMPKVLASESASAAVADKVAPVAVEAKSEKEAGAISQALENKEREALNRPRTYEKLLFAGNHYISVLQTIYYPTNGESGQQTFKSDAWVDSVEVLGEAYRQKIASGSVTHLTPHEVIGTAAEGFDTPYWTITRSFGKWVGQASALDINAIPDEPADWEEIPVPLPETATSYNDLAISWAELEERYPGSLDAFTSKNEDVLAVRTADSIDFYANRIPDGRDEPSYRLALADDEAIVLVQWTQNTSREAFIDKWARQVASGTAPAE